MIQNVILQDCDLERLRSSVKVNEFSIRPPPQTHKYLPVVQLQSFNRWLQGGQEKERQNMTETL